MIDKPETIFVCIAVGLVCLSGNVLSTEKSSEVQTTTPQSENTQLVQGINMSRDDAPLHKTAEGHHDDRKGSSVASNSIITIIPKYGNLSDNETGAYVPSGNSTILNATSYVTFTGTYSSDGEASAETLRSNNSDYLGFGMRETAGFVAIGFLIFAVSGYIGFVLWRRYLQKKYGSQTLITEEVYDISDLRHFEI